MHVHEEVLAAANDIVAQPGSNGVFSLAEVLRRLAHLNERTVRTHVVSRCCVNAPKNHPHRWKYFLRVGRGQYEIVPEYRRRKKAAKPAAKPPQSTAGSGSGEAGNRPRRETIHVIVSEDKGIDTAECVEIAVATQGRSLDDLLKSLNEAITLHLEGEDLAALGLSAQPRLQLLYEVPLAV